jgi:hypothetical protein
LDYPAIWLFFLKQKSALALCSTDQLFHEQYNNVSQPVIIN